eukprot:m.223575 g.223575  ORF g.223575 m.223575 type:complete len:167 (+) comp15140_c1_seq11:303-803(+)
MRARFFSSRSVAMSSGDNPKGNTSPTQPQQREDESMLETVAKYLGPLGRMYLRSTRSIVNAKKLYGTCCEPALSPYINRVCNLPDTFQSWFLVTQLHVWLCLVRLKQEGKDGRAMYRQLVEYFWHDVEFRMKSMAVCVSIINMTGLCCLCGCRSSLGFSRVDISCD